MSRSGLRIYVYHMPSVHIHDDAHIIIIRRVGWSTFRYLKSVDIYVDVSGPGAVYHLIGHVKAL